MKNVANDLAIFLRKGNNFEKYNCVCLNGELGVGKTTLVKLFVECLGFSEMVSSPSFNIVNEYVLLNNEEKIKLFHFDFFRIKTEEELFELAWSDYADSSHENNTLLLVEWADKFTSLFSELEYIINVNLSFDKIKNDCFEKRLCKVAI